MPSCKNGHKSRVCQPTLESDRLGPGQTADRSGPHCSGGTSLEDTAMVPLLLQMLIALPCLINHNQIMLNRDLEDLVPQLAIWHISGRNIETKSFWRKLACSCSSPGGLRPTSLTTHSLASGIAGVVQGAQIPFQAL